MGSTYTYVCETCNYSANVSGGPDIGFIVRTQTGHCTRCVELVDIVTAVREPGNENRISIGLCPKCNAPVTKWWNDGDGCPKCEGPVNRCGLFMDWD